MTSLIIVCGCGGQSTRDLQPMEDAAPSLPDADPEPIEVDADATIEVDADLPVAVDAEIIVPTDADRPVELSCVTGAVCAMCCPTTDVSCQMSCVAEAPPSTRGELTALVTCLGTSGCSLLGGSPDFACLLTRCRDQIEACEGGASGTAGCLSTAWCLYGSGCSSMASCPDQGLCYQSCIADARPEVMDIVHDVLGCVADSCATPCASGFSSGECMNCLGNNCGPTLARCLRM